MSECFNKTIWSSQLRCQKFCFVQPTLLVERYAGFKLTLMQLVESSCQYFVLSLYSPFPGGRYTRGLIKVCKRTACNLGTTSSCKCRSSAPFPPRVGVTRAFLCLQPSAPRPLPH